MISIGKRRSSLRDLDHLRIEPGIEMPGYCQCVALRRPNALCPRSSTANCHWPVLAHGHQLGLCRGARPSRWPFPASRHKPFPNPNGIESSSPRLRGRATLGNRPTKFSTRNGLHHLPSNRMKPRWGKNYFTITTRRSRCASTPG